MRHAIRANAGRLAGICLGALWCALAAAQTPIKFALDWKFEGPAAPYFVAIDKGYYKAEGLDVTIDQGSGNHTYTRLEPYGVVAIITPWNAPLMLATWRIAPALAAGNTVVAKPPEWAPLTASLLADIAAEAGLPAGVFNPYSGVKTSILLINNEAAKQRDEILFVKISNELKVFSYTLGRSAWSKSNLACFVFEKYQ